MQGKVNVPDEPLPVQIKYILRFQLVSCFTHNITKFNDLTYVYYLIQNMPSEVEGEFQYIWG